MSSAVSFSLAAGVSSFNWATLVAEAIGAVTLGRAISHASATCACVAPCAFDTLSSAARIPSPRSLKFFFIPPPRADFPRSASDRYFAEDITEPFVLDNGYVKVPEGPGIGVEPIPDLLEAITTSVEWIGMDRL